MVVEALFKFCCLSFVLNFYGASVALLVFKGMIWCFEQVRMLEEMKFRNTFIKFEFQVSFMVFWWRRWKWKSFRVSFDFGTVCFHGRNETIVAKLNKSKSFILKSIWKSDFLSIGTSTERLDNLKINFKKYNCNVKVEFHLI